MDEHEQEGQFVGICQEPVKEASEELGVPVKSENLGAKIAAQVEDCNGDASMVEVSDSGVCNRGDETGKKTNGDSHGGGGLREAVSGTETRSLEVEARGKANSVSEEEAEKANVERAEELGGSVNTEATDSIAKPEAESENDNLSERTDKTVGSTEVETKEAVVKLVNERGDTEPCDGAAGSGEKRVTSNEAEMTYDTATSEIERKNGEIDENTETEKTIVSVGSEVTGYRAKCDVEVETCGARDDRQTDVDAEKKSDAVGIKGSVVQKGEDDNDEMDVENMIGKVKDERIGPSRDEQIPESSEPVSALEEPDQVIKGEIDVVVNREEPKAQECNARDSTKHNSAAETCPEAQVTGFNQKREKGEAMEINSLGEEEVKEVDKLGDAHTTEGQDVPTSEADQGVEKKTGFQKNYVEEPKDKDADTTGEIAEKIVSKDSTDPDNLTEDASTGNIQEIKTDTEGNTEITDTAKEVTTVNGQDGLKLDIGVQGAIENVQESVLNESKGKDGTTNLESRVPSTIEEMEIDREAGDSEKMSEGIEKVFNETHVVSGAESPAAAADGSNKISAADLGSSIGEENLGRREEEDIITEQEGDTHEALNVDQKQVLDTEMAEKLEGFEHDENTDSDTKTSGVKRKADALSDDDSSQELRKTISVAKVSVSPSQPQRSSFKIGACIARAATQMAGPPSGSKGSPFSDDLSVDKFLSELQSAATNPVRENVVSEISAGFFLDFRSSVISRQPPPDKGSGKRSRPSDSNIGGTEAFEFEELSDTYWTDRVIHNGGEDQTPPAEKGEFQIVPVVELKPAQIQRSRRPYTKRKHAENNKNNISLSASDKAAVLDKNAPAELIMNFSEMDMVPSEIRLNKMFRHFGPIRESQTEVDKDCSRARVVFKKCGDAEVAYNSAGRFNIFGTNVVNYELSYTITEPFKVQPYVVNLGGEEGAECLQSHI